MDILDLPDWTASGLKTVDGEYELSASYDVEPDSCIKCGVIGRLYGHGTKQRTYRDSPIRGHSVRLIATVRRYKCRDCGGTFLQPLGGVLEERQMTERCAGFIQKQCLLDTFIRIAKEVGCDEKTVRNVAKTHITDINNGYLPKLPQWLGIDETKIDGAMRCVITDIGARRPIEMLPSRDRETVGNWFARFPDRSIVKGVAIDMWRPYRNLAADFFPGVPVVIDKFHVVRMANYCMERVRIRLGKAKLPGLRRHAVRSRHVLNKRQAALTVAQQFTRDLWLENDPEMKLAYELKESFYAIYKMRKADAIAAFDAYPATVPPILKKDFKVLLTAMRNWRDEILAYFDHPISNAYTESLNGVAKAITRAGRGYTFEVLRARLLFKPVAGKVPRSAWMLVENKPAGIPGGIALMRCESCGGLYPYKILAAHIQVPPIASRERLRTMTICRPCHQRLHAH